MALVSASSVSAERPYHHGDLRNALVDAAIALAREGGPSAIVLREVARRVGVSPNAAYRHFAATAQLLQEVSRWALAELGTAMLAELGRCPTTGDATTDSSARLMAVGRAYVHFALREPGVFAAAFDRSGLEELAPPVSQRAAGDPYRLLNDILDELNAAGAIAAGDRDAATTTAWAGVHGLTLLLLGPMCGIAGPQRDQLIEAVLGQILTGVLAR